MFFAFSRKGQLGRGKQTMKKICLLIGILSLFLSTLFAFPLAREAHAELSVKDFIIIKDTSYFSYYINGIYQGLRLANSSLSVSNRKMFFCIPDTVTMDTQQLGALIEDTINAHQLAPDVQIEPIVLMSLQETFPCSN